MGLYIPDIDEWNDLKQRVEELENAQYTAEDNTIADELLSDNEEDIISENNEPDQESDNDEFQL